MLVAIFLVLVVLWFLGYGPVQSLDTSLFQLAGRTITLWDILIFLVVIWLIDNLPRPLREITVIFLLIWLLSLFGVIAIAGLSNILVIALIIGLLLFIVSGK